MEGVWKCPRAWNAGTIRVAGRWQLAASLSSLIGHMPGALTYCMYMDVDDLVDGLERGIWGRETLPVEMHMDRKTIKN